MKTLGLLLPIAMILCWGTTAAADRFTLQIGGNHSTADTTVIGGQPIGQPPPELPSTFSGTGLRVGATVRVYRWLHVDAGWAKFGDEDRFTSYFFGPGCVGAVCPDDIPAFIIDKVEQSGAGYWVAAAPTFESGSWRIMGKLGIARTSIESQQATDETNRRQISESGLMYGFGAGYYFTDLLGIRFDFEQLGSEAHQFGLSLSVRF